MNDLGVDIRSLDWIQLIPVPEGKTSIWCSRCQISCCPNLPITLRNYAKFLNDFCESHRHCKERKYKVTEEDAILTADQQEAIDCYVEAMLWGKERR